jgi:type I restriction enzyme R subunit
VPSQLIDTLNERFSNDFTILDQLFFEQIHETEIATDALKQAGKINTKENFAPVLKKHLEHVFIDRMDGNERLYMQYMNDEEFQQIVFNNLLSSIHDSINREDPLML